MPNIDLGVTSMYNVWFCLVVRPDVTIYSHWVNEKCGHAAWTHKICCVQMPCNVHALYWILARFLQQISDCLAHRGCLQAPAWHSKESMFIRWYSGQYNQLIILPQCTMCVVLQAQGLPIPSRSESRSAEIKTNSEEKSSAAYKDLTVSNSLNMGNLKVRPACKVFKRIASQYKPQYHRNVQILKFLNDRQKFTLKGGLQLNLQISVTRLPCH